MMLIALLLRLFIFVTVGLSATVATDSNCEHEKYDSQCTFAMFGESEATNDIAIDSALVVKMLIEAINEANMESLSSFHALEAERTEEYAVLADTDDAVIEEDDSFTSDDEEGMWWDRRLAWGKFIYRGGVKCLFCPWDDGDADDGDDLVSGDEARRTRECGRRLTPTPT